MISIFLQTQLHPPPKSEYKLGFYWASSNTLLLQKIFYSSVSIANNSQLLLPRTFRMTVSCKGHTQPLPSLPYFRMQVSWLTKHIPGDADGSHGWKCTRCKETSIIVKASICSHHFNTVRRKETVKMSKKILKWIVQEGYHPMQSSGKRAEGVFKCGTKKCSFIIWNRIYLGLHQIQQVPLWKDSVSFFFLYLYLYFYLHLFSLPLSLSCPLLSSSAPSLHFPLP